MKYLVVSKDYKNIILAGAVIRASHRVAFEKQFPGVVLAEIDATKVFIPWVCNASDFTNTMSDDVAGYSLSSGEAVYR